MDDFLFINLCVLALVTGRIQLLTWYGKQFIQKAHDHISDLIDQGVITEQEQVASAWKKIDVPLFSFYDIVDLTKWRYKDFYTSDFSFIGP